MDHPDQVTRETAPLDPTGHLLYKTTLLRPRDITVLPNTKKQA